MKILVCCKIVVDEEHIVADSNGNLLTDKLPYKISQYDLNALEAAKQLAKTNSASISVLTLGINDVLENSKIQKDILSRGADELILVKDDENTYIDSLSIAKKLSQAIKAIEDYDLVLTGTGSSDIYQQTTGSQIGYILSLPTLNNVSNIMFEDDKLIVERSLDNSVEKYELELPAVLSVSSEINTPSIPAMKEILKAAKKPVNISETTNLDPSYSIEIISELAPEHKERANEVLELNDDSIEKLITIIKKEAFN